MAWTANHPSGDPALVTVDFSGAVTGAELREATMAAAAVGQKHGVMRYLVDATAVERQPGELEFFVLPAKVYDELGLDRAELRIAVLVPPAGSIEQMIRFYETACLNRGWHVKIFDAREPAVAWLGVP